MTFWIIFWDTNARDSSLFTGTSLTVGFVVHPIPQPTENGLEDGGSPSQRKEEEEKNERKTAVTLRDPNLFQSGREEPSESPLGSGSAVPHIRVKEPGSLPL